MQETTFTITGTHCNACKALIEDVLRQDVPGIASCVVDFKSGETKIEHDENLDWNNLKRQIEALGNYEAVFNLKQKNT